MLMLRIDVRKKVDENICAAVEREPLPEKVLQSLKRVHKNDVLLQ